MQNIFAWHIIAFSPINILQVVGFVFLVVL